MVVIQSFLRISAAMHCPSLTYTSGGGKCGRLQHPQRVTRRRGVVATDARRFAGLFGTAEFRLFASIRSQDARPSSGGRSREYLGCRRHRAMPCRPFSRRHAPRPADQTFFQSVVRPRVASEACVWPPSLRLASEVAIHSNMRLRAGRIERRCRSAGCYPCLVRKHSPCPLKPSGIPRIFRWSCRFSIAADLLGWQCLHAPEPVSQCLVELLNDLKAAIGQGLTFLMQTKWPVQISMP